MKTIELINRTIEEIRLKISPYSYEGNIPLEQAEVEIKLDNGTIIPFPHHPEAIFQKSKGFNRKLKKVFPGSILRNIIGGKNRFKNIEKEPIVAILKVIDGFGDEICGLEFRNGYIMIKGPLSPIGTGNANLLLFNTIEEARDKYDDEIQMLVYKYGAK